MSASCESLVAGARKLEGQAQPSTPKRSAAVPPHQRYVLMSFDVWLNYTSMYDINIVLLQCSPETQWLHSHQNHWSKITIFCQPKVKEETGDVGAAFSPETQALIKGLSDSPESLALKSEILRAANELKRGPLALLLQAMLQEWHIVLKEWCWNRLTG